MNCPSARCSCASWPRITVKRAPESLAPAFAIQPAMTFAEIDVILDLEIESPRRAPATHFVIVSFVFADRYRFVRNIGDEQRDIGQFRLHLGECLFVGLELVANAGDLRHQRRDILALALGLADGLGAGVAQILQLLRVSGQLLALAFQRLHGRHVEREASGFLETRGGFGQARTQQCGVQHDWIRNKGNKAGLSLPGRCRRNAAFVAARPAFP